MRAAQNFDIISKYTGATGQDIMKDVNNYTLDKRDLSLIQQYRPEEYAAYVEAKENEGLVQEAVETYTPTIMNGRERIPSVTEQITSWLQGVMT